MTSDLNSTLNAVARGKISAQKAQLWIEENYVPKKQREEFAHEGIKLALGQFKKLKKIQENISQSFPPIGFGFSANIKGIESKLSVFRAVHVSPDSEVSNNHIIGSQCFGIEFSKKADIKGNKFTAVQLSEFTAVGSNVHDSHFSLSRLSNTTIAESRFEQNKLFRSTWSDISIAEADFTEVVVNKSDFSAVVINASRLSKLNFTHVDMKDCEFDACNIQGIEFENCELKECTFSNVHIVSKEPVKISERKLFGKAISNCNTVEELLSAIERGE